MTKINMPLFSPKTYLQIKNDPDEEKEPFFLSQDGPSNNTETLNTGNWQSKFATLIRGPTIPWLIVLFLLLSNTGLYLTHSSSHNVPWTSTDFGKCPN
jgi:hypothetical protein